MKITKYVELDGWTMGRGWTVGLHTFRRFVGVRWHDKRDNEYYHPVIGLTIEASLGYQLCLHLGWKEVQLIIHKNRG